MRMKRDEARTMDAAYRRQSHRRHRYQQHRVKERVRHSCGVMMVVVSSYSVVDSMMMHGHIDISAIVLWSCVMVRVMVLTSLVPIVRVVELVDH